MKKTANSGFVNVGFDMRHQSAAPSAILLPESQCFQIPPFQRNYSWTPERIQKLIYDVGVAATQEPKHWIGIMLAGPAPESSRCGNRTFGHQCWIILDGQQRVLSLRLILLAISDEIQRQTGSSPTEIDRSTIASINVHGLDEEDWRQIDTGKAALLSDHAIENNKKLRIRDAYLYIRWILLSGTGAIAEEEPNIPPEHGEGNLLDRWVSQSNAPLSPAELLGLAENILTKLELSLLVHEDIDEPVEVIFESLNGLRTELGQYDLFRNFLLTQANVQGEEQRNLYNDLMKEPEQAIDQARLDLKEYGNLQHFLSDFVVLRPGMDGEQIREITRSNSAQLFKEWWQRSEQRPPVRDFIRTDLSSKMRCWLAAASGQASINHNSGESIDLPKAARRSIWRIEMFSRSTYTPVTTLALESWLGSNADDRDEILCGVLHAVETVLAREVLSGASTRGRRNRMQDALPRGVGIGLPETLNWMSEVAQSDHSVKRASLQSANTSFGLARKREDWFTPNDLYMRSRQRPIFALFDGLVQFRDGLEYSTILALAPGTRSKGKNLRTVEHFCPQGFLSSREWCENLRFWEVDQQEMVDRLHAIGNLTVLPLNINSAFKNSVDAEKRAQLKTERFPRLKINNEFLEAEIWGPKEIDARSEALVEDSLKFWKLSDLQTTSLGAKN